MSGQIVYGGKNVYGRPLGILMLQSRFPRIPGDAGNASTWPFPVAYRVVDGADPATVVRRLGDSDLLGPFIEAARELEREGVSAVTTNCGFLVLYQERIQAELSVPFLSSSLLQVPWLQALQPAGSRVGVLTVEHAALTTAHLAAAGIAADLPIVGMEEVPGVGRHFLDMIIGDENDFDVEQARREHVAAAELLRTRHPDVGAIVLECTNMPPYAAAVRDATGLPVHDLTTLVTWFTTAHRRTGFSGWM